MGSYTTNLNLYKPTVGETGWGALVNTNFDTIDGITPAQIGAEPAFTKNTAFNKNFGTASGTVCKGDDSRLSNARTPTKHASTHASGGTDAITIDASQTTSGTFNTARIPNLDASKITSGVIDSARIPQVAVTTSNLTVDSDLDMTPYDVSTNNLNVSGNMAINGSVLQVVECIPDENHYILIASSDLAWNGGIILPFIPSTYYTGSVKIWCDYSGQEGYIIIHNVDGTTQKINASTIKRDIVLPDGTIGITALGEANNKHIYVGYIYSYLPLPTP